MLKPALIRSGTPKNLEESPLFGLCADADIVHRTLDTLERFVHVDELREPSVLLGMDRSRVLEERNKPVTRYGKFHDGT